ncbi:MAG: hypothetical protein WCP69_08690 [Bacteroidota bacterium]
MKKSIIIALLFASSSFCIFGQVSIHPSIGAQFPIGTLVTDHNLGNDYGANISLKFAIDKNFDIGLTTGFNQFSTDNIHKHYSMIPITGLLEKRFGFSAFAPAIALDFGFYNFSYFEKKISDKVVLDVSKTITNVGFAPSAGFYFKIDQSAALTAMFKYHFMFDPTNPYTFYGINIGLNYKFNQKKAKYNRF